MTELTDIQQKIQTSLITAISENNLKMVQEIFNSNENDDIQAALRHEGAPTSEKDIILYFAITRLNDIVEDKEKFEKSIKIIELIWQKTNQKIRDSVCDHAIESFENSLRETVLSDIPALETVIQEMEEHKRVMDLSSILRDAIKSLNVNQVEAALENCGENVQSVLDRIVYWVDGDVDAFLVYPLEVKYSKELNQEDVEKIKEIFELMFNAASPQLLGYEHRGNNYVMSKLVKAQKRFAKIPGVGEQCFQDLIQKFEEKLSKDTLDNAKADDQIAWDKEYATRFSQEINHDLFENDELNACIDDTDLGQNPVINTANPELTNEADNKTPEKNDTNFWSEHKGKIALDVTGLCVAGAVAAYVLAYPVVALALTVLAAVILMGAGIAKFCEKSESPNTKSSDPDLSQCCNKTRTA
ncbi:hypothetical protein [Wolbachia endosymbiont (group A) of Myopa testacea]|uniref:hypothetical protein n=1 Tax=Wolbachia endosymbiont (group A) of Myopa testacea TaxID=3066148 RepID=UPI003340EB4B